ncbi:hypothetical protein ABPG74_022468 [Tetrahymena malaccensis]
MGQYLTKNQITQNQNYDNLQEFINSIYSAHTKLFLEFMNLTDQDVPKLVKALRQCKNLIELDFLTIQAKINKISLNEIFQALLDCKEITILRIQLELIPDPNQIGEEIIALGNNISKFKKLKNLVLWISYYEFGTEAAISLGNGISQCSNLSSLNISISYFDLQFDIFKALFSSIGKLRNLKFLKLCNIKTEKKSFTQLGEYLKQIIHLEEVDLSFRVPTNNQDLLDFGISVGKCSNLKFLSLVLFENQFDYQGIKALAYQLAQIQNLLLLGISMVENFGLKVPLKQYFIRKNKRLVQLNVCLI